MLMMEFTERYKKLNVAQKEAVDTIEGPVMVIAGPGTGKTELISVRVANILRLTDTLPENILCLTFTDSGANAMRQRLSQIVGKDSYKVAVHTFHSFGVEIMNQNSQYFYQGAHYTSADDLSSYEIIRRIFEKLEYDNPLASKNNDEFTHLKAAIKSISELKNSGLTSDELLQILSDNDVTIEKTERLLAPIFETRINKQTAPLLEKQINSIRQTAETNDLDIVPLATVLADSLETAIGQSLADNSTKPITGWKTKWFEKNDLGKFVLKSRERQVKLRKLAQVYERYLSEMQRANLYDYDDMILRVVHAIEVFDDLRFNLQEKYQYVMVDEFQDTNMAQIRILNNLTNNIVQADTPNIMVVGDDDQAIYSFQGADVSNIFNFQSNLPKAKQITLKENYRSGPDILTGSRDIIVQGKDRLENIIEGLDKNLTPKASSSKVQILEAQSIEDERHYIVTDIKSKIKAGEKPNSIAVLARNHNEINRLLPYFYHYGIKVNYERRDNALEIIPVKMIEKLSRLLVDLFKGRHDEVNALLPEVLTHRAWGIKPEKLCEISLNAHKARTFWLDIMSKDTDLKPIYDWMVQTALLVNDTTLENMLDIIIGKVKPAEGKFVSPIYGYFFSEKNIHKNPDEYLTYLDSLRAIRMKLREYKPNETPTLATFIEFIELNRKLGKTISILRRSTQSSDAVNVMTAHKSKGLEFDFVYIMNAVDNVWGDTTRTRSRMINYPENLPLAPTGDSEDERLRLFYVATTRAKKELNISYSETDDFGKETMIASFLVSSNWEKHKIPQPQNASELIEASEMAWYQPIVEPIANELKDLLAVKLENYRLSVTHLQNFLNIEKGGPSYFLINSLLHFPQAKSANLSFGTAIHDTLNDAHNYICTFNKRQAIEDIVSNFENNLRQQHLSKSDFSHYLQKGSDTLRSFLENNYDSFSITQQSELDFNTQHCIVENAHITGKLDLVDIDGTAKTAAVIDYKTGKPALSWNGKNDMEKLKLYRYKQQLMFYKLLIENSRDYHNYHVAQGAVQFVEPTLSGNTSRLGLEFKEDDVNRLEILINAVWRHIMNFDLPDISSYEPTLRGVLAFEQDLINGTI